jgi:hypothetical protein
VQSCQVADVIGQTLLKDLAQKRAHCGTKAGPLQEHEQELKPRQTHLERMKGAREERALDTQAHVAFIPPPQRKRNQK